MSCMHITYPFCKFSLFSTTVLNHVNVFWRYNLHIMPEARSILAGPIQPHVLANLLLRSYRKPMDAMIYSAHFIEIISVYLINLLNVLILLKILRHWLNKYIRNHFYVTTYLQFVALCILLIVVNLFYYLLFHIAV